MSSYTEWISTFVTFTRSPNLLKIEPESFVGELLFPRVGFIVTNVWP